MQDEKLISVQIGLSGKLITAYDSTKLIEPGERSFVIDNFKILKNMRYTDNGIIGIPGMSKINTSPLSKPKIRRLHQLRKDQPVSESYILAQAFDSAETASAVYKNSTSIPNQGDFDASPLYTDDSGATVGSFSDAPQGHIVYCNGVKTLLWGGNENKVSSFIIYDPNGDFKKDYTEQVQNSLTDAENIATITTASTMDANVMLLLHCEGATFTDSSPTTPHTITAVGNAQISTTYKHFEPSSGYLDGTGDWLTIPDDADFNFSGGNICLDGWFRISDLSAIRSLMGQKTDAERYWRWYVNTDGSVAFKIFTSPSTVWANGVAKNLNDAVIPTVASGYFHECTIAGTTGGVEPVWVNTVGATIVDNTVTWTCRKVVDKTYTTDADVVRVNKWIHLEFDEKDNKKYIFADGYLLNAFSDTNRIADMLAGVLYIGANEAGANPYFGYFVEIRISNVVRHTSAFEPATDSYGTSQRATMRIGNVMPVQAIKFYIVTANTSTSTIQVYYWDGEDWIICSNIADGTSVGGISLAQTGIVSFNSTANIAKPSIMDGIFGYWYKAVVTDAINTCTISQVTVDEPFQRIRDIWDGEPRTAISVQKYIPATEKYEDNTINVFEDRYTWDETVKGDESTYMKLGNSSVGTFIAAGFNERTTGIQLKFIPGKENVNIAQASVYYWNGSTWKKIKNIIDGTYTTADATMGQSGFITWDPIEENIEFRTNVGKEDKLYYYRIRWNAVTSGADDYGILCYYISGIPVQKKINPYKFGLLAQNRLWLFNNIYENKSECITTRLNTYNVFNGKDAGDPLNFQNNTELVAAKELFVRYTSGVASSIVVCKKTETFVIEGDNPENRKIIKLSSAIGCNAPETMKASPVGLEYSPLQAHQILIWQGVSGIYYYNGNSIMIISDNISNYFDPLKAECINKAMAHKSVISWDDIGLRAHWYFASGSSTTLNKEVVWDLRRQKWYETDRSAGKYLQCEIGIHDSNGYHYNYGSIDTGYLERLENGQTFDGSDIVSEFQTPDLAIYQGSIMYQTQIRTISLPQVSKILTANSVVCTHYGDAKSSGTTFNLSPKRLNYRIAIPAEDVNLGNYIFHSLNFKLTTNNEIIPFEPLYAGVNFKIIRQRKKEET